MPNFSPYANYGYLALIKETTAGVAVIPTNLLRLIGESVVPSFAISPVMEIAGDRHRNIRSVPSKVEISGDIEFYVESKMIGHFLRSLLGAPTTQTLTAAVAFRHTFEVGDTPQTYTLDIQPGDAPWIHRFYGVQVNKIAFDEDENKLKCTASVSPRKTFVAARATVAANSGTALVLDQTAGLIATDTIIVLDKADGVTELMELTVTSVTDSTTLVTSTISVQIDVDDIIVIKRATVNDASYDQDPVFTWMKGGSVYSGATIDDVTEVAKENFTAEYLNEVEPRWFGGPDEEDRYPGDIVTKGFSAAGTLTKFYDQQANLDIMRKNAKLGIRLLFQGNTAIEANSAVKAKTFWGTGNNGFEVEATVANKAGNDFAVVVVIAASDNLSAAIDGKTITVSLADTTASKNTGTLIAAVIDSLSGIDSVAEGTGADQFTAAIDSQNLGDTVTGATAAVVGRDASEVPYMQLDFAAGKMDTYFPSAQEDGILEEEIPFTFYKDVESGAASKKWAAKIRLVNAVSGY